MPTRRTHAHPQLRPGGVALVPGIENVVVEGLVGMVCTEATRGDKTRVALERREEHLRDARGRQVPVRRSVIKTHSVSNGGGHRISPRDYARRRLTVK